MKRSLRLAGIVTAGSVMTILLQFPAMLFVATIFAPHMDFDYWGMNIYYGGWIVAFAVSAAVILLLDRLSRVAN